MFKMFKKKETRKKTSKILNNYSAKFNAYLLGLVFLFISPNIFAVQQAITAITNISSFMRGPFGIGLAGILIVVVVVNTIKGRGGLGSLFAWGAAILALFLGEDIVRFLVKNL